VTTPNGLQWTRDGRSRLHSHVLGPAPLRPGVRLNLMRTAIAVTLASLISLFGTGCGRRSGVLASASISWIHPSLPRPTPVVAITNSSAMASLPRIFEGYDQAPPNVSRAEAPMYDCIIGLTKKTGQKIDVKVYLPRTSIFPGMWRHPDGQLFYFDDSGSKKILEIVAPYTPKELKEAK
jgi:hypothetical protein